jgi:VWFA-related protein
VPRNALALILPLLLMASTSSGQEEQTEPLETDLTEEVEVRFVILDTLVVDSQGRAVPDLVREDFVLRLDRKRHPVESVDVDCPAGAFEEPSAVHAGQRRERRMAPEIPRRVVLAVDYRRLPQTLRIEVVERLQRMVLDNHVPAEELMVVAITRRLRVEQPFTSDTEKVSDSLERMKNDPSLWQEQPLPYYHEFHLFDALTDLIRMLAQYDGRKAIVLFSEMPSKIPDAAWRPFSVTPAAFDYDRMFQQVAAAAMDARVPIYTIHARGLSAAPSSERLARLALETGGRFTRNTNDLSLAYVRAQRDLACRYAVGFYDTKPDEDRMHEVNIKVRRPGVRVIHARRYRFGFGDVARASLKETVYTAPAAFGSGTLSGALLAVRPVSSKQWEAAVVLRFPVTIPAADSNVVTFGAKLDDHARRAVHSFDSSVKVEGHGQAGEQPVMVVEPAYVAPGEYELSIVVNDPGVGEPRSLVTSVKLPKIPRKGLVVVDPVLVRQAAEDMVVNWVEGFSIVSGGTFEESIEPLVPNEPIAATPLTAITSLCWPQSGRGEMNVKVGRSLSRAGSDEEIKLPSKELKFTEEDRGKCRQLVDELGATEMEPGGYEFEVSVGGDRMEEAIRRQLSFEIVP